MKFCSTCNKSFAEGQTFCPDDGEVLQESPESFVGRVIDGKYRIEGFIAQGGMGAVYRARHILLGDEVVIKTLRSEMRNNSEWLKRFQREGKAARAFRHPNSVTVYDLSSGSDGMIYMVMEYVEGHTLDKELKARGRFTPEEALEVLEPVADVLDAAHGRGVVHRDLKPENIMLGSDGRGGTVVKVLDLGIAKIVGAGDVQPAGVTSLTIAGQILGTPYYMSPEQWGEQQRDGNAEVDGRTDIYSLGVIFFELVAGRKPLTGTTLAGAEAEARHGAAAFVERGRAGRLRRVRPRGRARDVEGSQRPPADGRRLRGRAAPRSGHVAARARTRDALDRRGALCRHTSGQTLFGRGRDRAPRARHHGRGARHGDGRDDRDAATPSRRARGARPAPAGSRARDERQRAARGRARHGRLGGAGRHGLLRRRARSLRRRPRACRSRRPSRAGLSRRSSRAARSRCCSSRAWAGGSLLKGQARRSPRRRPPRRRRRTPPRPPAAPKAEAASFWFEAFDKPEDAAGKRVAEAPAALKSGQRFRFHFIPKTRGYLYIVGPGEGGNAQMMLLTARGAGKLRSNLVGGGADFAFPSMGGARLKLDDNARRRRVHLHLLADADCVARVPRRRILARADARGGQGARRLPRAVQVGRARSLRPRRGRRTPRRRARARTGHRSGPPAHL